jgi:hypothetical protein
LDSKRLLIQPWPSGWLPKDYGWAHELKALRSIPPAFFESHRQ